MTLNVLCKWKCGQMLPGLNAPLPSQNARQGNDD